MTKQTKTELTDAEIKYERRVKSIELAIKNQGKCGCVVKTLVNTAEEIYKYLNS